MYKPVVIGQKDTPELKAHREKMLAAFAEAWSHMPDLGFGQMLCVGSPVFLQFGLFGVEDAQALTQWQEFSLSCADLEKMITERDAAVLSSSDSAPNPEDSNNLTESADAS